MSLIGDLMLAPINEKFHGRVRDVSKIEKAIASSREEFINKSRITMNAYGHKSFTEIEDAIRHTFGFGVVDFDLVVDPSYNAYTYPIATSITSAFTRVSDKVYEENKYDGTNFCLYVRVTTGMWVSPEFSDAEVTAILLHEIGHNFQHINNSGQRFWGQLTCISRIFTLLTTGDLSIVVADANTRTTLSKMAKNSPVLKAGVNVYNGISGIMKYFIYTIIAAVDFVTFGIPSSIIGIVMNGINPIGALINGLVSGISKGAEFNADSFVASFGYGAEMISALGKLELNNRKTGVGLEELLKNIPILGHINNMMSIPAAVLLAPFSSHPLTGRRMNNVLAELKTELKRSDLSPALRKEVEKNIAVCEEILEDYKEPRKDSLEINRRWLVGIIRRGKHKGAISAAYGDMEESMIEDFSDLELTTEEVAMFRKVDGRNDIFLSVFPEVTEYDEDITTDRFDYWF